MRNLLVARASIRRAVGVLLAAALSSTPAAGTACPALCGFRAHHDVTTPTTAASPHDGHGSHHDAARLTPFAAERDVPPVLPHPASPSDGSDVAVAVGNPASVVVATCCCPRTESALSRPARAVRIDTGAAAPTPAAVLTKSFQMPPSHSRVVTRERPASAPHITPPQIVLRV